MGKAPSAGKGLLSGFGESPRLSGLKVAKITTLHPVCRIDSKTLHVDLLSDTVYPCFELLQFGLAVEGGLDTGNKRRESTDVSSNSLPAECGCFD
jgi:hypothetical protein